MRGTIYFLLLMTLISALVVFYFVRSGRRVSVPESALDKRDLAVLSDLRSNGLPIAQSHMCGMGNLATYSIEETSENEFHICEIYLQHNTPELFVNLICQLPEIQTLHISNQSALSLTISNANRANPKLLQQLIIEFYDLDHRYQAARVQNSSALEPGNDATNAMPH